MYNKNRFDEFVYSLRLFNTNDMNGSGNEEGIFYEAVKDDKRKILVYIGNRIITW